MKLENQITDRPRERLLNIGATQLSNAELIALILRTGTLKSSALVVAQGLLEDFDLDLKKVSDLSTVQLMNVPGLGSAKASSLIACFELGKRLTRTPVKRYEKVMGSRDVFEYMHQDLGALVHEEFWVLYLNNANRVIERKCLSKGGLTGTLVDIRILLKYAIVNHATSIIVCHNHPSGSLKPSHADKTLTQKLIKGAITLDLQVLDHLIITEKDYFSFADNGLIS
ncbi:MAG: RadC family protein [Flavobacteriaceae bacterium]